MSTEQSFKPSKQFIIRGSIAIGIVAIILIVQTAWFRALFHKKPISPFAANQTVGDIISRDTNGNGIADWEETLWGLDPTVLYTNGVSNKQIIEEKKKALGGSDASNANLNDTDRISRELFVLATALGQTDGVTDDTLQAMGAKLAESVDPGVPDNLRSVKDIKTVQTTKASLTAYAATMKKVTSTFAPHADTDIIINAIQNEDASGLSELNAVGADYQTYATKLLAVSVPAGLVQDHLRIINSLSGLSKSFAYIQNVDDNSIASLVGIAMYRGYTKAIDTSTANIKAYLIRYGILSS